MQNFIPSLVQYLSLFKIEEYQRKWEWNEQRLYGPSLHVLSLAFVMKKKFAKLWAQPKKWEKAEARKTLPI